MQYQICEAKSARILQLEVTHLIGKGWRPIGGISVVNSPNSGNWWYYQAMILGAEKQDEEYPNSCAINDPEFV